MKRYYSVDEIQAACDAMRMDEEMVSHMRNAVVHRAELCYDAKPTRG